MLRTSTRLAAALASAALCATAQAQTGPVSYWRFDEGSGALAADSAGTNHGAIQGGAAHVPGVAGSALSFDGGDDYVRFDQTFLFNAPGDATMLLWVKRDDDNHRTIVWGRDGADYPDADRFHIFTGWLGPTSCEDGQYGYAIDYREPGDHGSPVHRLPCAPGITPGQWSHVAFTRQGDTYSLYVNGTLARRLVDEAPRLPTYQGLWTLGLRNGGMSFLGAMDELALYARALSAEEIRERYERTLRGQGYEGPPPAGATCTQWNLAGDFRTPPAQANPSPDACGVPVWSYLWAPSTSRDPSAYALLPDFARDWEASTGLGTYGWHSLQSGQGCSGSGDRVSCVPIVGFNASGGELLQPPWLPFPWYGATALSHPGPDQLAVIAFRAPFTGVLQIDAVRFTHLDFWSAVYGGDGVDWTVDLGTTNLGGGIASYLGGPGVVQGQVNVTAGDMLYATLGPNGGYSFDTTQVDVGLHMVSIEVAVDVKPGGFPNAIKLSAGGVVPAAVLGSAVLDAASVDPASLVLAGAPVARLPGGRPQASLQDVNADGRLDLVAQFPASALRLGPADATATLAGALRNGTAISGADAVVVRP